jgi:hypothetical protein
MTAVSGPRRRVGKEIAPRLIGARGLPIGLRIWALVARRPIDSLAILAAGVASIVIIINAVFLQSGFRQGTDQSEGLVSKLQKPQEFLKSKGNTCSVKSIVHWQELHLWKRDLVREAGDDRLKMLACFSSGAGPGVGYMLPLVISGNRVWHPGILSSSGSCWSIIA